MTQLRHVFPRTRNIRIFAIVLGLGFCSSAFPQTNDIDDLRRRLDEKDRIISDLQRRVEALENRSGAPRARPDAGWTCFEGNSLPEGAFRW